MPPSNRARIYSAVGAARAGRPLDAQTVADFFGYVPGDDELNALRNQLALFNTAPLDEVVNKVIHFLESRPQRTFLALEKAVDDLFSAAAHDGRFPLRVRHNFGVVSRKHEDVLRHAIKTGQLSKSDALSVVNNGQKLSERLSGLCHVDLPIDFRTVDAYGMPQREHGIDGVHFEEAVAIQTAGQPFQLLISNESELRQAAVPERDTISWLESTIQNGSVLWDVGANIGYYSLYATSLNLTTRVVSFEPGALNIGRLNANIRNNGFQERIIAFPIALSDETSLCTFGNTYFIAGGWAHRGIVSTDDLDESFRQAARGAPVTDQDLAEARRQRREVFASGCVTYSLDDFMTEADFVPAPTHLKIDVDGPELKVLNGGPRVLREGQLRHLLIETATDGVAERVTSLLAGYGFLPVGPAVKGLGNRIFEKI